MTAAGRYHVPMTRTIESFRLGVGQRQPAGILSEGIWFHVGINAELHCLQEGEIYEACRSVYAFLGWVCCGLSTPDGGLHVKEQPAKMTLSTSSL